MIRRLQTSEMVNTCNFGGFYPYWMTVEGEVWIGDSAEEMIINLPVGQRIIDPVAVLELLSFNHMLGDRTLVQGIRRLPWHATLNGKGEIKRKNLIPLDKRIMSPGQIAERFIDLLSEELISVSTGRKHVHLLLSGGLDSRIIAGVLKKIEPQISSKIICVTWGQEKSRDVEYARRIAGWFNWDFVHLQNGAEQTWENIQRGAIWGGTEVSGIHLHGTPWFTNADPEDVVLATSYGSNIGKGQFSRESLLKIHYRPVRNHAGLLRQSLVHKCLPVAEQDRTSAWDDRSDLAEIVKLELDREENYVRRMLVHSLGFIHQYCEIYQTFTSDAILSFAWSLAPECRTPESYTEMFKRLDPRLYSLPWSHTGVAPDGTLEVDKSLNENHHNLPSWLRNDLRDRLGELYFSEGIRELGLFSSLALKRLWNLWLAAPSSTHISGFGETVAQIASLEISRRHFGLTADPWPLHLFDYLDTWARSVKSTINSWQKTD